MSEIIYEIGICSNLNSNPLKVRPSSVINQGTKVRSREHLKPPEESLSWRILLEESHLRNLARGISLKESQRISQRRIFPRSISWKIIFWRRILKEESLEEESLKEESLKEESLKEKSLKEESLKEESLKEESLEKEFLKKNGCAKFECFLEQTST